MKNHKILLILLIVLAMSLITPFSQVFHHTNALAYSNYAPLPPAISSPIPNTGEALPATPAPAGNAPAQKTSPGKVGPDQFPAQINPLTGLPVADPALLSLPPALISVSNFPLSARPQAGLSFAPFVYELYIGEGMTRFLALFYGGYPQVSTEKPEDTTVISHNQAEIGPIRSGRLPYQAIRQLYSGFLVMASASAEIRNATGDATNIFGSDSDDINSALIDVTHLQTLAEAHAQQRTQAANLTGNLYEPQAPQGGKQADKLWVFYNFYNQAEWVYDPVAGSYLRFQDQADGSGLFFPATDRLTGEQLAFENVIVLFVEHEVLNSARTLIDFDLLYNQGAAYLFRDGQVYPIYWNTVGGAYEQNSGQFRPIRFTDRSGNPIPLKPGSTWVEMVDLTTTLSEIETGHWKARFYAP